MKKIILLTGDNHFFGQTRKPWVSANTLGLIQLLQDAGLEITEMPFHRVINSQIPTRDAVVIYTFSQRGNLRAYIRDAIYALKQQGNAVIPSYELLLCHENKGYQECLKKELGIASLPALYFSSSKELAGYEFEFPLVLKTIDCSNGKGVYLIKKRQQLENCLRKLERGVNFWQTLDLARRKYLRPKRSYQGYPDFDPRQDYRQYKDYITPGRQFILQKFVPGLEYDYRVIILGGRYYVSKRLNRKGDFRASGAKRFTFNFEVQDALLNYAHEIFLKFNAPCLSLDIGNNAETYYLFEFQTLHFGINAIVRGEGYYRLTADGWEFVKEQTVFEQALAEAFLFYLQGRQLV